MAGGVKKSSVHWLTCATAGLLALSLCACAPGAPDDNSNVPDRDTIVPGQPANPQLTPQGPSQPQRPQDQPPRATDPEMQVVGFKDVKVAPGARVKLTVSYTQDGGALAGAPIMFQLSGERKGATLSTNSATTSQGGFATVELIGGTAETTLVVQARGPRGEQAQWNIAVTNDGRAPGVGELNLRGAYDIKSTIDMRETLRSAEFTDLLQRLTDMGDSVDDPGRFFTTWIVWVQSTLR